MMNSSIENQIHSWIKAKKCNIFSDFLLITLKYVQELKFEIVSDMKNKDVNTLLIDIQLYHQNSKN